MVLKEEIHQRRKGKFFNFKLFLVEFFLCVLICDLTLTSDLSELASVSVRDIVKAIGGQDPARSNGNASMSPLLSRSSSPVSVPSGN